MARHTQRIRLTLEALFDLTRSSSGSVPVPGSYVPFLVSNPAQADHKSIHILVRGVIQPEYSSDLA
jgi:hypothetical protein